MRGFSDRSRDGVMSPGFDGPKGRSSEAAAVSLGAVQTRPSEVWGQRETEEKESEGKGMIQWCLRKGNESRSVVRGGFAPPEEVWGVMGKMIQH